MRSFKLLLVAILLLPLFSMNVSIIGLEIKSLLNDRIELGVPKGFEIMSEEIMKIKYPSSQRPNLVFTNELTSVNVALSLTQNDASQELITPYVDNFVKSFNSQFPTADWKDKGTKMINGRKVGFIKVITPAVDTDIYNVMFFTDLDGKLLL